MVRAVGFEPTTSPFQGERKLQTFPYSDMAGRYRIELQSTVLETVVIAIIPTPYVVELEGTAPSSELHNSSRQKLC